MERRKTGSKLDGKVTRKKKKGRVRERGREETRGRKAGERKGRETRTREKMIALVRGEREETMA